MHETGIIAFTALRAPGGDMIRIEGRVKTHGVMTSPLIGYDTGLPAWGDSKPCAAGNR